MKETKPIIDVISTTNSKLSNLPIKDGQLIFVHDSKKIALDYKNARTVYEQIQVLEKESNRTELLAPINSFYFVVETSILWKYHNGQWIQLTNCVTPPPEKYQYSDAIINTMSGESPLVIPDSAERVNKRLELGGKTEQFSTKGLNLFNYKDFVDISTYADEGAGYRRKYLQLKPNTSYRMTIFKNRMSPSMDATVMFIGNKEKYDNTAANGKIVLFTSTDKKSATIVTGESGQIVFKLNKNSTPELQEEYLSKADIILSEGSTEIPYEPYTGGKPSPSPEYPQEIKSVGKWNDEKQKYEVEISISGRNLFDFSTCEEGKIFEGSGNIVSTTNGVLTDFIPCFPNSQYSRSRTGSTVVAFYDCNKNKIGFEIVGNTTFVTPEKCRYFRFSAVKTQVDYTKIVACPGNTVMDYEPYKKPQSLTLTSDRPITKWDRLVEQGGQIGWLYQSSKMILDGTKIKWLHSNKPENSYFATTIIDAYGGKGASFCKTYRNIQDSAYVIKYANERCIYSDHPTYTSGDKFFRAPNENVTTLEQWKEFIDENPIEMLYHTKNSEFVPLPQSEQNAIRALTTHYPTTVITVDGGELDLDIKVTYTADTKNYIDGKVSAKVASILRQYQADTANLLSLMPMETQATMIENDTNNILNNLESEEAHE